MQKSATDQLPKIAIIGAGMAGLSLAHFLDGYADVTLFEKSRGVGGRMSTRYAQHYQFDHGAQFFTARSKSFNTFLKPLLADGTVQPWQPRVLTLALDEQGRAKKPYKRDWFERHYVAAPKMNHLAKVLAKERDIHLETQLSGLKKTLDGWLLEDIQGHQHGVFDWVVSTAPAPQTAALLPQTFSGYADIRHTNMAGCYCLMLGLSEPLDVNWQVAVAKDSCIAWIAVDSSKPGRGSACSLVVHSTNEWAEQHLEDDQQDVEKQLFLALQRLVGQSLTQVEFKKLHRWRYATSVGSEQEKDSTPSCLFDPALQLGVCGDWLLDGHVESAFLSALALSKKIIPWLGSDASI